MDDVLSAHACVEFCRHPGSIKHGQILLIGIGGKFIYRDYVVQIKHNDRIEYVCDRDYLRIGPPMATCVHTSWSPPNKPICIQQKHPGTQLMYRGRRSVEDGDYRRRKRLGYFGSWRPSIRTTIADESLIQHNRNRTDYHRRLSINP
jgi:hypothetical protein